MPKSRQFFSTQKVQAELDRYSGILQNVRSELNRIELESQALKCQTKPSQKTISTIHHLSACGGTIISKCLAAQPNVILLSEVHPLNLGKVRFNPFDPIQQFLVNYSKTIEKSLEKRQEIFLDRIHYIQKQCELYGKQLVLRDHSHSDFLRAESRDSLPLLDSLKKDYRTNSVITLRSPIDAFLSMKKRNWTRGVKTFDEYCRRILLFVEAYEPCPVFHYEDFVLEPQKTIENICNALYLQYDANFMNHFHKIKLTGDSGRSSRNTQIAPQLTREFDENFRQEVLDSSYYKRLCQKFGYEQDPAIHAIKRANLVAYINNKKVEDSSFLGWCRQITNKYK